LIGNPLPEFVKNVGCERTRESLVPNTLPAMASRMLARRGFRKVRCLRGSLANLDRDSAGQGGERIFVGYVVARVGHHS
jgi:hypothetical protein